MCVIGDDKTFSRRHLALTLFDGPVVKLKDLPTLNANHMIMVLAMVNLKHRTPTFEIVTDDKARSLELRQHAVDRRKTHFLPRLEQHAINILRAQVRIFGILENAQNLQAGRRRLESRLFQFLTVGHHCATCLYGLSFATTL